MDEETIPWLLEAETPSIAYLTLRDLLDLPEENQRVMYARRAIMVEGPVPAILAEQTDDGSWVGEQSYYTPKYTATHWSMTLLAELLVDGDDPRFRRGVEFMLGDTADSLNKRLVNDQMGWSCLYGNILRYTCRAGLSGDDRAAVLRQPEAVYGIALGHD